MFSLENNEEYIRFKGAVQAKVEGLKELRELKQRLLGSFADVDFSGFPPILNMAGNTFDLNLLAPHNFPLPPLSVPMVPDLGQITPSPAEGQVENVDVDKVKEEIPDEEMHEYNDYIEIDVSGDQPELVMLDDEDDATPRGPGALAGDVFGILAGLGPAREPSLIPQREFNTLHSVEDRYPVAPPPEVITLSKEPEILTRFPPRRSLELPTKLSLEPQRVDIPTRSINNSSHSLLADLLKKEDGQGDRRNDFASFGLQSAFPKNEEVRERMRYQAPSTSLNEYEPFQLNFESHGLSEWVHQGVQNYKKTKEQNRQMNEDCTKFGRLAHGAVASAIAPASVVAETFVGINTGNGASLEAPRGTAATYYGPQKRIRSSQKSKQERIMDLLKSANAIIEAESGKANRQMIEDSTKFGRFGDVGSTSAASSIVGVNPFNRRVVPVVQVPPPMMDVPAGLVYAPMVTEQDDTPPVADSGKSEGQSEARDKTPAIPYSVASLLAAPPVAPTIAPASALATAPVTTAVMAGAPAVAVELIPAVIDNGVDAPVAEDQNDDLLAGDNGNNEQQNDQKDEANATVAVVAPAPVAASVFAPVYIRTMKAAFATVLAATTINDKIPPRVRRILEKRRTAAPCYAVTTAATTGAPAVAVELVPAVIDKGDDAPVVEDQDNGRPAGDNGNFDELNEEPDEAHAAVAVVTPVIAPAAAPVVPETFVGINTGNGASPEAPNTDEIPPELRGMMEKRRTTATYYGPQRRIRSPQKSKQARSAVTNHLESASAETEAEGGKPREEPVKRKRGRPRKNPEAATGNDNSTGEKPPSKPKKEPTKRRRMEASVEEAPTPSTSEESAIQSEPEASELKKMKKKEIKKRTNVQSMDSLPKKMPIETTKKFDFGMEFKGKIGFFASSLLKKEELDVLRRTGLVELQDTNIGSCRSILVGAKSLLEGSRLASRFPTRKRSLAVFDESRGPLKPRLYNTLDNCKYNWILNTLFA